MSSSPTDSALQTSSWSDREVQDTEEFTKSVRETNIRGLVMAGGLAWFGMLIFWFPDHYVMPDLIMESLIIRVSFALFAFGIFYGAVAKKSWVHNHSEKWVIALLGGVGSGLILLCWMAGGLESQYYAAFNLIYIAGVLMFTLPRPTTYAVLWGLYALYLSPVLLVNNPVGINLSITDPITIFNNQFFLLSTLLFCTVGYHFRYQLIIEAVRNSLQQQEVNEKLEVLANHDQLTGIPNRRSWLDDRKNNGDAGDRPDDSGQNWIIMVDIDHFKDINDEYGHQAGDEILKDVAQIIVKTVREKDDVARFGGEEFIVKLTDTDDGKPLAERIRTMIENEAFTHEEDEISLTVSVGIARWKSDFPLNEIISCADGAMYRAKANGRNQVQLKDPENSDGDTLESTELPERLVNGQTFLNSSRSV